MKWVTRKGIRVNRAARAWLIRRFIDPQSDLSLRRAGSQGFPLVTRDDQDTVRKGSFLYDALYASLAEREAQGGRT